MKKILRSIVIIFTLLLGISLINCQTDDDTLGTTSQQLELNKDVKVTSKRVNAADIPYVINFVKSKSSPSLTFKFNETNHTAALGGGGTINHENNLTMTKVITEEIEMITTNNLSNYAFDIETNSSDYFLNLIVSEYGESEFMYFIKYVADPNASRGGLLGFTGTLYYYSETGVFKMSSTSVNGVINDNCPCDGDDGDGGGGGEDCNDALKWLCDWRGNFHDSRADCTCEPGIEPGCGGTYVITNPPGCGGNTSVNPDINSTITTTTTCPCGWDVSDDGEEGIGGGGGGGTPTNNCPGVAPCRDELQSLDANCECTYVLNPITPVNTSSTTPCPGDPVYNPQVASQKGSSGTKGALQGCTRYGSGCTSSDGRTKPHAGIDLKSKYGSPIYAMYGGSIYSTKFQKDKAGYNTRIQSTINGKTIIVSYFHMQEENRILQTSNPLTTVKVGDIIGYQGDSGNLKKAITDKTVDSHIHIEVREHDGSSNWNYDNNFSIVDPRDYLATRINDDGASEDNRNCN